MRADRADVELSPEPLDSLSEETPRLLLVADDEVRGRRLTSAFVRQGASVAPARSVDEVVVAGSSRPSIFVLSCAALRGEGVDALRRLATLPEALVVVVVPAATPADVRELLRAGARGLVLDEAVETALAPTIDAVASGQLVLPATARRQLAPPTLSNREKQVLALVVLGFSNADIAAQLHVTEATVKSHLTSSFAKLEVRSRSEASARILDPHDGLGAGILSIPHGDVTLGVFAG